MAHQLFQTRFTKVRGKRPFSWQVKRRAAATRRDAALAPGWMPPSSGYRNFGCDISPVAISQR